jgi:hypothetical protein
MTSLDQARRYADQDAQEARELILGMASRHENLFLVLDAVLDAMGDVSWGDVSLVVDRLHEAQEEFDLVVSFSDQEERSAWVAEDLAEQKRAA